MAMGLVGIFLGTYVLINPHWVLDFFWGGKAAPAAYQALTYTDSFLQRQGPLLLALILLNIPLNLAVAMSGRRSAIVQRIEFWLSLFMCAAMAWTIADGPILMTPSGDQTAKALMAIIVAFVLIDMGVKRYRSVRPSPDKQAHVSR